MARKIFLSVLGTSFYHACCYCQGEYSSAAVPFIQQAMLELHEVSKTWDKQKDKIMIVLTDKARWCNWDKNIISRRGFDKVDQPYMGLEAYLYAMGVGEMIEIIDIPSGENNEEIWTIFTRIYDALQEGDELYIDITHSFRYLPMVLLVLCNYVKFLKGCRIMSISYGNYEARDQVANKAPIIDLLPISLLQDWTFAGANFLRNGRVGELLDLSEVSFKKIGRANADKRFLASSLRNELKRLSDIITDMQLCQGKELLRGCRFRKTPLDDTSEAYRLIPPLSPVMQKVVNSFVGFQMDGRVSNLIASARWCLDKQLYQQTVTLLREGIVTYVCHLLGEDAMDMRVRETVSGCLPVRCSQGENENNSSMDGMKQRIASLGLPIDFRDAYNRLTEVRNYINHAGMQVNERKNDTLKKNINGIMAYFESYPYVDWKEHKEEKSVPEVVVEKVFLNLSNHSYDSWNVEQKEAAAVYGRCIDIPFPLVNAWADESVIDQLADRLEQEVMKYAEHYQVTVHLMGEMTLCFALLTRLGRRGIPCVASSASRNVIEKEGVRTSVFAFSRFRRYHIEGITESTDIG